MAAAADGSKAANTRSLIDAIASALLTSASLDERLVYAVPKCQVALRAYRRCAYSMIVSYTRRFFVSAVVVASTALDTFDTYIFLPYFITSAKLPRGARCAGPDERAGTRRTIGEK